MGSDAALERRLAAILAADVVGFSRLVGADEAGTLARLRQTRRDVIEPAIAAHRGRVFKLMGDGLLAEFGSAVAALRAAIDIQEKLRQGEGARAEGDRLQLRIGVHQGDVVVEDGDLLGDGVNVAARLEALAEPGGICVSARVREDAAGKLDMAFEDGGEQTLKNIARPVRVFRVRLDGVATPSFVPQTGRPAPPSERSALSLPDKPSLAVLPFQNMSGDPEQEYFADGMVEDITTALSRVRSFFVIARNSSFTYKGRAVDVKQVGRELGVRYVLEGSVRKAGNRVRISGQLVEAETGHHIWADRFEGALEDVFEMQDRVTECVVAVIAPHLQQAEINRASRKAPENMSAYDFYLRALPHAHSVALDKIPRALDLLNRSIAIDPSFAPAHAMAAWCHLWQVGNGVRRTPQDNIAGREHVDRALALDPDDPAVLWAAGIGKVWLAREHAHGLELTERSVSLNPNSAMGWATHGWVRLFCAGGSDEGIASFQRAMRLSPLDPMSWYFHGGIAQTLGASGRDAEAIEWTEKAFRENPDWIAGWRGLATYYARLGMTEKARHARAVILKSDPDFTISRWLKFTGSRPGPWQDRFVEGLRLAGLPE